MKKLFLFVAILVSCMAQADSYRDALKTVITSPSFSDMKNIQEGLQEGFYEIYSSMNSTENPIRFK